MRSLEPTRFASRPPALLAGLRRVHPLTEGGDGLRAQWQEFTGLGPIDGQVGSAAYGVMCGLQPGGFEYLCAVEVTDFAHIPDGLGRLRLLAQQYAVFLHEGTAPLRETWQAIFHWLAHNGRYDSAHKPDFELYPNTTAPGPEFSPVEIWVAVTRRCPAQGNG